MHCNPHCEYLMVKNMPFFGAEPDLFGAATSFV